MLQSFQHLCRVRLCWRSAGQVRRPPWQNFVWDCKFCGSCNWCSLSNDNFVKKKKKKNSHTTGAGQAECICGWVTECRFFKRRQWLNGSFLAIDSLVVVRVVQTTLQCFCRAEKERGFQLVDHVDFMKQAMVKHAITTKKQSTLLKTFAPKWVNCINTWSANNSAPIGH